MSARDFSVRTKLLIAFGPSVMFILWIMYLGLSNVLDMKKLLANMSMREFNDIQGFTRIVEGMIASTVQGYIVISVVGGILAFSLLLYLGKSIIGRLNTVTEKIRRADLDEVVDFRIKGKDEIGILAEALHDRNKQLQEAKEEIQRSVEELREINRQLVDAKQHVIQSEKMAAVGMLAAGVAHEINNPVGFVNSNIGALADYIKDFKGMFSLYKEMDGILGAVKNADAERIIKKIKDFGDEMDIDFVMEDMGKVLDESKEGLERIRTIVAELKDFSRIDEDDVQESDINQCVESAVNIARYQTKHKAEVVKEFSELPFITVKPKKLNQVFLNSIVNAVQAMPEKGEIRIKTYADEGNVIVKISDTGSGMSEETKRKLFDPFYTTKPVGTGTGLGMYITYGIIEEHKGEIEVESTLGKGTTFTFKLPIDKPEIRESTDNIR